MSMPGYQCSRDIKDDVLTEALHLSLVPDEVSALGGLHEHVLEQLLPILVYVLELIGCGHECV